MWIPLSQFNGANYLYVFAFTSALLFWVLQGPRLGKKELKAAHISDDLVSGGIKYFAAFLAAVGIYAAMQSGNLFDPIVQAGSIYVDAAGVWAVVLTWCTSGALFLVGAIYVGRTDVITGLPLVVAAIMMSVHPLVIAEFVGKRNRSIDDLKWIDSLWIDLFQSLALFPGVSRSGSTITGGMTRDLMRPVSARFSFLMSIPIMLMAGLVALGDLSKVPNLETLLPTLIPGFIAAAVTGYLAIRWLLRYLTNHPLYIFSIYCGLLGLITIAVGIFR